jgi:AcrR family transcriptional regulator
MMTMGHLGRARSPADKASRRSTIVSAAASVLERRPYAGLTMADVAREARVAKGTLFLYFPSKEALFLDLADQLLDEWLGGLHRDVARDTGTLLPGELAAILTASLAVRPLLARLLPLCTGVLEQNVPAALVAEFRHHLMRRLFATGALVEQRLRLARNGDGVRALRYAYALIIGLRQRADAPGPVPASPERPADAARADDDTDLRAALTILFNGFHRKDR